MKPRIIGEASNEGWGTMWRCTACLWALLACVALTVPSNADEILVSDSQGDIADVNTVTGAVTNFVSLTSLTSAKLTDVAYTSNGKLYGTTFPGFYSISGGVATQIGPNYSGDLLMNALTGSGTGLLGAATNSTSIYTINTGSGVATVNGAYSSGGYASAGDLTFVGSTLYESVVGPNGSDGLVNASTGKFLGYFYDGAYFNDFYGLVFDPTTDTLYGVAGTEVFTVDLSTCNGSDCSLTMDSNWGANTVGFADATGATIAPTPLPAALPLFATGLGALGFFGWRRKRKNTTAVAA